MYDVHFGGKHQNKQNEKNNPRNNFEIERGQHESENEPGLEIIYLTIQTYIVAKFLLYAWHKSLTIKFL